MSEKRDNMIKELRSIGVVSLVQERIMLFKQGYGEIQYWFLKDSETTADELVLSSDCISIPFSKYSIVLSSDNGNGYPLWLDLFTSDDKKIASLTLPRPSAIINCHNVTFVDEFAVDMSETLAANKVKGDWFVNRQGKLKDLVADLHKNLTKVKASAQKEEIKKSCIDIGNYAMMLYHLYGR